MTSYARFDHASWLKRNTRKPVSEFGARVAYIIGVAFGGIYNAPVEIDAIKWNDKNGIVVPLSPGVSVATYDRSDMTMLVLLAHELSVRVAVHPLRIGYRYGRDFEDTQVIWDLTDVDMSTIDETAATLELVFWQREPGTTPIMDTHPTIDQAVANFRGWFAGVARELAGCALPPIATAKAETSAIEAAP